VAIASACDGCFCRTIEETTALVWGVEKMGGGRWAEIKKLDCPETESLERRTAVDLKDKWRNLQVSLLSSIHFFLAT
jgi:hypothetical protein